MRPISSLRVEQSQVMTFALHQSLRILQMSQLELADWMEQELERNPLFEESSFRKSSLVCEKEEGSPMAFSLRNHLLLQAREHFTTLKELRMAELLIGELDERGRIPLSLELPGEDPHLIEKVLLVLKTFDPPGVAAQTLQESYLLQMTAKPYSLAEVLIRDHFADLLKGRFAAIQKKLNVSYAELQKALDTLSRLPMHPASQCSAAPYHPLIADLTIREREERWVVEVGEEEMPPLKLRSDYLTLYTMLGASAEKKTLRTWITGARWLQRCLKRRKETLFSIGELLLKTQKAFLTQTGPVIPLAVCELARYLEVHESTAWRAVVNKTLHAPQGMIPLKRFFSESSKTDGARELIETLIGMEDKKAPLTDEALSKELSSKGLTCARRTITKYRKLLKFASAKQRRRV